MRRSRRPRTHAGFWLSGQVGYLKPQIASFKHQVPDTKRQASKSRNPGSSPLAWGARRHARVTGEIRIPMSKVQGRPVSSATGTPGIAIGAKTTIIIAKTMHWLSLAIMFGRSQIGKVTRAGPPKRRTAAPSNLRPKTRKVTNEPNASQVARNSEHVLKSELG